MDNYKIKIPNPEVSELVQRKAFELGYVWYRGGQHGTRICTQRGINIYTYADGRIQRNFSNVINAYFNNHDNIEISWEDFLRLGEAAPEVFVLPGEFKMDIRSITPEQGVAIVSKLTDIEPPFRCANYYINTRNERHSILFLYIRSTGIYAGFEKLHLIRQLMKHYQQ